VLGARTESVLAKAAAEIDPEGAHTAYRSTDITDEAQCEALAALATEKFGRIDAVVHVAAWDSYFGGSRTRTSRPGRRRRRQSAGHAADDQGLPAGAQGAGGSVVIVGTQSSVAAPSEVHQAAYAASKGALTSAMYSWRASWAAADPGEHGAAGWMWGPPVQAFVQFTAHTEGVPEEEVLARLTQRMALPELATDGDVAEAAAFLASDRARAITGQSLLVNAGNSCVKSDSWGSVDSPHFGRSGPASRAVVSLLLPLCCVWRSARSWCGPRHPKGNQRRGQERVKSFCFVICVHIRDRKRS